LARSAGTKARRQVLHLAAGLCASLLWPGSPLAQGIEQAKVALSRPDGAVALSFDIRMSLPNPVENALRHGVPIYFVAQATLYRQRWYWRDERVSRVSRTWRLAYQPLTNTWRVSLGGLGQGHASLAEALASMSRSTQWKVAEAQLVDSGARHYVEFSYRLDTSQLPGPMQIGLVGQGDWPLEIERTLRMDPPP
jgi:Domain of unknown function (DUF4390)